MHCGTGMSPGLPQPLMLGSGSAWGVHSAALTRRGPISRNSSTAETTGLRRLVSHLTGPCKAISRRRLPLGTCRGTGALHQHPGPGAVPQPPSHRPGCPHIHGWEVVMVHSRFLQALLLADSQTGAESIEKEISRSWGQAAAWGIWGGT